VSFVVTEQDLFTIRKDYTTACRKVIIVTDYTKSRAREVPNRTFPGCERCLKELEAAGIDISYAKLTRVQRKVVEILRNGGEFITDFFGAYLYAAKEERISGIRVGWRTVNALVRKGVVRQEKRTEVTTVYHLTEEWS